MTITKNNAPYAVRWDVYGTPKGISDEFPYNSKLLPKFLRHILINISAAVGGNGYLLFYFGSFPGHGENTQNYENK